MNVDPSVLTAKTSNNNLGSGVPDPYGSGKVDEETYNSLGIGDKYCF